MPALSPYLFGQAEPAPACAPPYLRLGIVPCGTRRYKRVTPIPRIRDQDVRLWLQAAESTAVGPSIVRADFASTRNAVAA